jgi:glutamyl-tRNA reductase
MISEAVSEFLIWLHSRGALPTVVALRRHFEMIRRSELERLEPKLNGLAPDARTRVDEVTRLLVQKLLLTPTEQLKTATDPATAAQYAEAIAQVFQLDETSSAGVNDPTHTDEEPPVSRAADKTTVTS